MSSSADLQRAARNDTSTRFEAGKQAGPDTIEHFLGGGAEGHAAMANWLHGGFEMDRNGAWRLKPQVADTLQRDVQAVMIQTGWQRALSRSSSHQISNSTEASGSLGASAAAGRAPRGSGGRGTFGQVGVQIGASSTDTGTGNTETRASLDVMNYDVRSAVASAERAAGSSTSPEKAFTDELGHQILVPEGLRNRLLGQADAARGVRDLLAPVTTLEQRKILDTGRFSGDLDHGPLDGDSEFKRR